MPLQIAICHVQLAAAHHPAAGCRYSCRVPVCSRPPLAQSALSTADLGISSEDRHLRVDSAPERRPRVALGDIGGRLRASIRRARSAQPAQHRHHEQVAGAECAFESVDVAKAPGTLAQPYANVILEDRQALLMPRLVTLHERGDRRSRIGGSTVLRAADIHVIARARALASPGSGPSWRSAVWSMTAPDSKRARSPSS